MRRSCQTITQFSFAARGQKMYYRVSVARTSWCARRYEKLVCLQRLLFFLWKPFINILVDRLNNCITRSNSTIPPVNEYMSARDERENAHPRLYLRTQQIQSQGFSDEQRHRLEFSYRNNWKGSPRGYDVLTMCLRYRPTSR